MDDIQILTSQAAEMLRCSYRTVINYCTTGKLTGCKNPVTGVWKVSLNSVIKLQKTIEDDITGFHE